MKAIFNITKNVRNSRSINALGALRKLQSLGLLLCALLIGSLQAWGADEVYKTAKFGSSYNSGGVSSYTASWSSTNDGFTVNIANGNNNNNGWNYVKFGRKNYTSVGTIITDAKIDKAVTKVTLTISAITATTTNSIKLYTSSNNSTWTEAGSFTKSSGAQTVELASPTANLYYKIEFDCASGSGNGFITVTQVDYYITSGPTLYTVTFDANGGSVTPASATQASAGAAVTLPTPTRSGYNCTGWYTATSGGTKRGDAGGSYTPTASETIHAQWSAKTYSNYRTLCAAPEDPAVTLTPTSITGLNYIVGNGPSSAQSFVVKGSNLTGALTVTPNANYEICLTNSATPSDWKSGSTTLSISKANAEAVAGQTVYVRLKSGLSAGNYNSQSITISGGGLASNATETVSGSVLKPTITADPTSVSWNTQIGVAAETRSVTVTGVNLSANISAELTGGDASSFSISTASITQTAGSASGSITITYTGSTAATTTKSTTLHLTSTNAEPVDVSISFSVIEDPREKFTLLTSSNISDLSDGAKLVLVERTRGYVMNTTSGTNGHEQVNTGFEFLESNTIIALEETNEVEVLTLVASDDGTYLLKTLGNQYIYYSSGNTHKTGALPSPVTSGYQWTISMFPEDNYVNIKSTNCLGYNGGASGQKFRSYSESTITGGYNTYAIYAYYQPSSDPSISLTASLSKFEYVYGSGPSSPAQTFTVSGKNLSNDLVVSVPSNIYEVSKNGSSDWGSSVSYTPSTGTVSSQTVYIRLKAGLSANAYDYAAASGLRVTSTGATERNAALEGEVKYSVSISANNGSYGSVSPTSGTTRTSIDVTATPNANYRVPTTGGYTVTSGTATVVNNGDGTFTITPTSNCAVTINFEAIPTHKVTYWATGTKIQESDVQEGAAIPDQTTETASGIETYCGNRDHFVGWTTNSSYSHATDAPAGMITGMSPGGTMSTSDVNYYAVFANTGSGGGTTFSRVTDLSQLADGDVIVIVSGSANEYILEQTASGVQSGGTQTATTSIVNTNSAQQWTLEKVDSNWKLCKDASNKLCVGDNPSYSAYGNTLTIENSYSENYFFIRSSSGTSYLEYYSGWKFWSTNNPSANNGNIRNAIYKQDPGYEDYTTQCCSLLPVTGLHVSAMGNNSVTLAWTLPASTTGITKFQVVNADNSTVVKDNISTSATNSGSISGLTKCQTYHFKVVSYSSTCTVSTAAVEFRPFGDAHTVTFNYNGGSGEPASFTTSCDGTSTTLPTPDARDGYTFLGWYSAQYGGNTIGAAGASYNVTSTTSIWAHWSQTNYTVTMQQSPAAGATLSGGTTTAHYGNTINISTDVPSGYRFTGWTSSPSVTFADASATSTSFTMPNGNVTVTAHFVQVHTLTFDVPIGGGSAVTPPATADHGGTVTLPNVTGIAAEYSCETFLGWTTTAPNAEGGTKWSSTPTIKAAGATSDVINSNTTFYAVYSRSGGGASGTVELTCTDVNNWWTVTLNSTKNSYGTVTHHTATDGSTWYTDGQIQGAACVDLKAADNRYIQIPTTPGTISSIEMQVSQSTASNTAACGTGTATSHIVAFRTTASGSNVFTGTSSDHSCTINISSGDYYTGYIVNTDNTTNIHSVTVNYGPAPVISHNVACPDCEISQFTLSYNANTSYFPGSTTTCTGVTDYIWAEHDDIYTICSTEPTLAGYKFTGWATNANGSGTVYEAGQEINCVPETPLTLYAQYERVYTIHFNDQSTVTDRTQASAGAAVTVPGHTTPCVMAGATWEFAGWSKTGGSLNDAASATIDIAANATEYTPAAIDEGQTFYAVYKKTLSGGGAFSVGKSGVYKFYYHSGSSDYWAAGKQNTYGIYSTTTAGDAHSFRFTYYPTGTYAGKYTIQNDAGEYIGYSGNSTPLVYNASAADNHYYWTITASGGGFIVQNVQTATRYLASNGGNFNGKTSSEVLSFVAADVVSYYTIMTCASSFSLTFEDGGGTINWEVGHAEGTYQDVADGTVFTVFPTATMDGWTFIGWTAGQGYSDMSKYSEGRDATTGSGVVTPEDADLYSTGGNSYTIHSNITMYPVFTRFEDNEPIDLTNGGDYYIYYLAPGSDDGYGAEQRVYAASYESHKRYNSTTLCSAATTFTFTKLENGNWTIYDNTTHMYLYGIENDDLKQQASATGAEWTLTINGNQFDAFHVGSSYGQLIAQGDGTSATIMNYRRTNVTTNPAMYHRVYLGSCTNRVFSSNPSTIPEIDLKGTVVVTASQNGAVRNTNVLTVSGHNLTPSTGEITITSNNSDVYFSTSANSSFAMAAANQPKPSVTVVANASGIVTPTSIYVHYKPSSNTDTWTSATITASYTDAEDAEVTAELRTVKENFVIASKVGDNWYALPANMAAEGVFEPVLIDVDESAKIAYGPATVGYKMWPVQTVNGGTDEYAANGDKVRFAGNSNAGLWASNSNNHIRNWATITAIGSTAETPASYEWIIETEDREAYTLKSMYSTNYLDLYRPSSGAHAGKLVWASNSTYETNEIHFFPLTEREVITIIPREWKANGLVFSVAADNQITAVSYKIGTGSETSTTYTRHSTGGYGLYEVALPDLTS